MPKVVGIDIECLAKTQVDRAAVRRWLDRLGVSPEYELPAGEAVSDPALLVALAAKGCYNSFEVNPDLNPNVTRIRSDWAAYLDNVLASAHGSVCEHSVYTFGIVGSTRVFTPEMNRHRAGWAVSEASLRYIRFGENIPYVETDLMKGPDVYSERGLDRELSYLDELDPEDLSEADPSRAEAWGGLTLDHKKHLTREIFRRAFASDERWYRLLEKVWAAELDPKSAFAGKKAVTSMMRRVVGMGVATAGVWTGNLRALRHVIALRTAPGAEEEIAHVFGRIGKYMVENEPLLFGDFARTPDGSWVPKYPKV